MDARGIRKVSRLAEPLALTPGFILSRDVFFQICGYLFPQDLLNLSRTTWAMRRELRSRKSRSVWTLALDAWPGLPESTPWLNGPRFAWLAFERDCEKCGASIPHRANNFWELGTRLCDGCVDSELVPVPSKALPFLAKVSLHQLMPTARLYSYRLKYYGCAAARPSQIEQTLAELSSLPADLLKGYSAERRAVVKTIAEHAHRCFDANWYLERPYDEALKLVLRQRYRDMLSQLYKEDNLDSWDLARWDEMYNTGPLSLNGHKYLRIPKPMSEEEWLQIRPEIKTFMSEVLVPLEAKHRVEIRWQRRNLAYEFFSTAWRGRSWRVAPLATASMADFMEFGTIKQVVERPSTDSIPVTLSTFQESELKGKIFEDHELWQDDISLALFWHIGLFETLLSWEGGELEPLWDCAPPPEIDWEECEMYLGLATSVFRCTNPDCSHRTTAFRRRVAALSDDVLMFPEVMDHECLRGRMLPPADGAEYPTPVRWNPKHMSLHRPLQILLRGIVRASGEDPGKTDAIVMECADARMVCGICFERRPLSYLTARTWWRCVLHYLNAHAKDTPPEAMTWKRLSDEAEEVAQEIAPPSYRRQAPGCNWRTFCTACPLNEHYDYRGIHHRKMKKHWAKCHSDLMLDDGDRMWEKGYVPRIDEPRPVRLKTIHKRSGMTEFFVSPDDSPMLDPAAGACSDIDLDELN